MKLSTLIESILTIQKSQVIGKELYVGDRRVLLLGLQTFIDDSISYLDEHGVESVSKEPATCMYLLYQRESDDEYDEKSDYDEMTNRRDMLLDLEREAQRMPGIAEIESFDISGTHFVTEGMSNGPLCDMDYISSNMIRLAAERGVIDDAWLDTDIDELWLAAYHVENGIYDMEWRNEDIEISVAFEEESITRYLGHVFSCRRDDSKINHVIEIDDETIGSVEVRITGLYMVELPDEKALVLEYKAPENIMPHFYSTAYLDDEIGSGGSSICACGFSNESPGSRYEFICYVSDHDNDHNSLIEIELFSYTIL